MTRLLLIRHALTDTDARLCGWLDVPLAPAGRAQVQALLCRPPAHPIPDVLYTSTLTRAREVAAALGTAWARQPREAEWAREIHCGAVEGVPLRQLQHDHPEPWARNAAQNDDHFAWPGGESYRQFRARVLAGLAAAATAHSGGHVAIVTHAGVISQVLGVIQGRPAAAWEPDRPDPLTATEVVWTNGAPSAVLMFNESNWY